MISRVAVFALNSIVYTKYAYLRTLIGSIFLALLGPLCFLCSQAFNWLPAVNSNMLTDTTRSLEWNFDNKKIIELSYWDFLKKYVQPTYLMYVQQWVCSADLLGVCSADIHGVCSTMCMSSRLTWCMFSRHTWCTFNNVYVQPTYLVYVSILDNKKELAVFLFRKSPNRNPCIPV